MNIASTQVARWLSFGFVSGLLSLTGAVALGSPVPQRIAQTTPTPPTPQIPAAIEVPSGQELLLIVSATGDQIYTCQAKANDANQFEWTLKAPEAELFDTQGELIGRHYGGPSWELNDSSKVVGQLQSRVDAPAADAIPWLLLQVKAHEGEGALSEANWIQRVDTVGGKAPQTGCDRAHQNRETRVGYSAVYYFYGDR